MEKRSTEGDRPVTENQITPREFLSNASHVKRRRIHADHGVRLNTSWRPIVNKYREGKVKRTAASGVK
jgi:hypothetical protein